MRRALLIIYSVLVLGVLGYLVHGKEQVLALGERIYLELAPVDPRSLMQGDYMRLRFAVAREAEKLIGGAAPHSGRLVVAVGAHDVAHLVRRHDGTALASDERLVRYRTQGSRTRIVPDSFLFQEGHAHLYQRARYAVFVYDGPDRGVLAGLADADRNILRPQP